VPTVRWNEPGVSPWVGIFWEAHDGAGNGDQPLNCKAAIQMSLTPLRPEDLED